MSSVNGSSSHYVTAAPNDGIGRPRCFSANDRSLVGAVLGSLASLRRQSPTVQIAAGAGGGVVAGYVFGRTSKMAAFLIGSTIIFLQFAECKGYLQVQSRKLKEDLDAMRNKMGEMMDGMSTVGSEAVVEMFGGQRRNSGKELLKAVVDNARFLCGFIGGILVGFGIS